MLLCDVLGIELVELIRLAGIELAPGSVVDELRPIDKGVPQVVGPEHTSDRAFELREEGRVVGAMLIEAQQSPLDDKPLTWPLYWAMLRKRVEGAPTWIVVLTTDSDLERASAVTLSEVIPRVGRWLVLGPTRMPRILDPDLAQREPALALTSALIHAGRDDVELVPAIGEALANVASHARYVSYDALRLRLSGYALEALEALVQSKNYEYKSDFALENQEKGRVEGRVEGRLEGRLEGRIDTLRTLLVQKFGPLDSASEARIRAASEEALDRYTNRFLSATTLASLLAD